ncbi:MAG TPA: SDR family NAD(P)-dependent oxidoreductase [Woeseiaceae bacterium]|nr:SDR family NAD(P)-dependent oxidoreductase [Woeseiaceae bacterium]
MRSAPSVNELLSLDGRRILVTGASGNIGQGIARRLHEAGADIIAHSFRNRAAAEDLIRDLGRGSVVCADLVNEMEVNAIFADLLPDGVVNNAATQAVRTLRELEFGDWQQMLSSNLDSAFLVTQAAARQWRLAGTSGAVVNIASIEGSDPAVGHAHYASSKAALLMFTRAAALEYGADGIRINAVSPGLIARAGLDTEWPAGVTRWLKRAPLARLGTPNDVADAVLFLLSPAARWISGANLVVDGGMSAQGKW